MWPPKSTCTWGGRGAQQGPRPSHARIPLAWVGASRARLSRFQNGHTGGTAGPSTAPVATGCNRGAVVERRRTAVVVEDPYLPRDSSQAKGV